MNQDADPDRDEVPRAVDRLPGRRHPTHSLPDPRHGTDPPALGPPSPTVEPLAERTPAAEVSQTPKHIYVTVELPGAPKDSLDIEATERTLTIDAPRVGAPAFHLEVDLPSAVDPESAKATYRNGILDVTLARIRRDGRDSHEV
ncbi:MAG TPA: Hsp20/alpha crystallin family protein [Thermoplasmata archaeon]|nr:Hsp20/alpha crystallin family protein [Thermoplasmata archaeon]